MSTIFRACVLLSILFGACRAAAAPDATILVLGDAASLPRRGDEAPAAYATAIGALLPDAVVVLGDAGGAGELPRGPIAVVSRGAGALSLEGVTAVLVPVPAAFNGAAAGRRVAEAAGGESGEPVLVLMERAAWTDDGLADEWAAMLAALGEIARPVTVLGGGGGILREDEANGVRLIAVGPAVAPPARAFERSSFRHMTLVTVRAGRVGVQPVRLEGLVDLSDYPGSEAEEVLALRQRPWARVEGFVQAGREPGDAGGFDVLLENPTGTDLAYEVEVEAPPGWLFPRDSLGGVLPPRGSVRLPVRGIAPALRGEEPEVEVVVSALYPLRAEGSEFVVRRLPVRVRPRGAEEAASARPAENGVLVLDGRSAVRIDLEEQPEAYTVECWVRGRAPGGRSAVVSRAEETGFALFWSSREATLPVAFVGTTQGLDAVPLDRGWEWASWTHLALCVDAQRARVFVGGRLAAETRTGGVPLHPELPLFVGADPDETGSPGAYFRGVIDELRVSSVVRYLGDFPPPERHRRDGETLVLLHFDTDFLGAFPDDSGRGNHGWGVGGPEIRREERDGGQLSR